MIGWSIAWGMRHKRHEQVHISLETFIIIAAALRNFGLSMKSSVTRIAVSETIVKMPVVSNILMAGEDKHVVRDSRLYLSAKYRK